MQKPRSDYRRVSWTRSRKQPGMAHSRTPRVKKASRIACGMKGVYSSSPASPSSSSLGGATSALGACAAASALVARVFSGFSPFLYVADGGMTPFGFR
mgnify:CR=1 FL=1|jgi:hypothetical protein